MDVGSSAVHAVIAGPVVLDGAAINFSVGDVQTAGVVLLHHTVGQRACGGEIDTVVGIVLSRAVVHIGGASSIESSAFVAVKHTVVNVAVGGVNAVTEVIGEGTVQQVRIGV